MNFRPLRDNVLVKKLQKEEKTKGGIIIPDKVTGDNTLLEGIVIAVGPGEFCGNSNIRMTMSVKPGDRVVWSKYSRGEDYKPQHFEDEDGVEYGVFREFEFHAVRTESPAP